MPSSHTAVAVAFTVASSLEKPGSATYAAPLALLVAWSRITAGRHFPTDVAAGAILGGAVGLATHVLAKRFSPERQPEDQREKT